MLISLYQNYEQTLDNVRDGTDRFDDYFERMTPDTTDILRQHLQSSKTEDLNYWLARLRRTK